MPANATAGTQTYASGAWGSCTISACSGGYNLTANSCVISATANNILVERIGDGGTVTSGAAAVVALQEFLPTGAVQTPVQTLTTQFTGTDRLTDSATFTGQGYFGSNGALLAVGGWNEAVGTTSVLVSYNKVVTMFNGAFASQTRFSFPTAVGSPHGTDALRSVVPVTATTFYTGGNGTTSTRGVWFWNCPSTCTATQIGNALTRNVETYAGIVFYSFATGVSSLGAVGTTPAVGGGTAVVTATSPWGFVFFDVDANGAISTNDLMYVADDGTTTGGGLKKFTYSGLAWTLNWSLLVQTAGTNVAATTTTGYSGLRGLTGTRSGSTVTLYATDTAITNNRLLRFVDSGSTPTSFEAMASAGTNYVFRGVDLKGF
jgi:hypothetical protein